MRRALLLWRKLEPRLRRQVTATPADVDAERAIKESEANLAALATQEDTLRGRLDQVRIENKTASRIWRTTIANRMRNKTWLTTTPHKTANKTSRTTRILPACFLKQDNQPKHPGVSHWSQYCNLLRVSPTVRLLMRYVIASPGSTYWASN